MIHDVSVGTRCDRSIQGSFSRLPTTAIARSWFSASRSPSKTWGAYYRDCFIEDEDRGHCQGAKTLLTYLNQDLRLFLCTLCDNASLIVVVLHA